jgi:ABC-type nitrate/sulfonate/bicarbonate transport system permease component
VRYPKRPTWLFAVVFVIAFALLWQLLAGWGVINRALFSSPLDILSELENLHLKEMPARSLLLTHVWTSLRRSLIALLFGSLGGVLIGLIMGTSRGIYQFLDPLITLLMPIPGIAMAPLFIVILGFGDPTIITVGSIAAFFPLAYNTAAGVRSVDSQVIRAARILGVKGAGLLTKVYLPWAAGHVILGLKLGLARCWRTVIAVEFIAAANYGLGYAIWDAAEYLRVGVVYGGIVMLILVYLVLEKGFIAVLERNTIQKWGMVQQ